MKTLLTVLLVAASVTLSAQKNVVRFKFKEVVAIQDLDEPVKFGTYRPVWNDKGNFHIIMMPYQMPLHLIVHTEDGQQFNIVIKSTPDKVKVPKIKWERKDYAIDLGRYE